MEGHERRLRGELAHRQLGRAGRCLRGWQPDPVHPEGAAKRTDGTHELWGVGKASFGAASVSLKKTR